MTTPTITRPANGSAYPAALAELMPAARLMVAETGDVPSRNALMKELRIGAPKAREVLAALTAETRQAHPDPAAEPTPHRESAVFEPFPGTGPFTPGPGGEPFTETVPAAPAAPVVDPVPAVPAPTVTESAATFDADPSPLATTAADPGTKVTPAPRKPLAVWPVWVLALPAIVAIWSGWVGLGELAGFGMVRPLPGIWDGLQFNSAITLPIGMEVYAAYALRAWLSGYVPAAARKFAKVSALGSLVLGSLGQVAYHLMAASGMTAAPWWITTLVACLPVAVLGMGATLAHLLRNHD